MPGHRSASTAVRWWSGSGRARSATGAEAARRIPALVAWTWLPVSTLCCPEPTRPGQRRRGPPRKRTSRSLDLEVVHLRVRVTLGQPDRVPALVQRDLGGRLAPLVP